MNGSPIPAEPSRFGRLRRTIQRRPRKFTVTTITALCLLAAREILVNVLTEQIGSTSHALSIAAVFTVTGLVFRFVKERPVPEQSPRIPPPHELPPDRKVIGRDDVVRRVVETARRDRIVSVCGPPGIGTSTVAISAARRLAPETRRQWYVDTRGPLADRHEDDLGVAQRILSTLAIDDRPIETTAKALSAIREKLENSESVLVLDNVADWKQVRWIARGIPGAYIIVAGDIQPPNFPVHQVGLLGAEDGLRLLRELAPGEQGRLDDKDEAVADLAARYLDRPQLIMGIARWLSNNRKVAIAELVQDLETREAKTSGHGPGAADPALRVVLDDLLRVVSRQARRLLELLAYSPVELTRSAVAALADTTEDVAAGLLQELVHHYLVEQDRDGSYRVLGAARPAGKQPRGWDGAWRQLVVYFSSGAETYAALLPAEDARSWFQAEDKPLLAVLREPPTSWSAIHLWRIAGALDAWFASRGRYTDRRNAALDMAQAAVRLGDAEAQASAELRLCSIELARGYPERARGHFAEATKYYGTGRSWPPQLHLAYAEVLMATTDDHTAIEAELVKYRQALPRNDVTGHAVAVLNMAALQLRRGRWEGADASGAARRASNRALRLLEDPQASPTVGHHARRVAAQAKELYGLAHWYLGLPHEAAERWEEAAKLHAEAGNLEGTARCEVHLGTARLREARQSADSSDRDNKAGEAASWLRRGLDGLPDKGVPTALAALHQAEATLMENPDADVASLVERGLFALDQWGENARPRHVAEIRNGLTDLADGRG